MQQKAFSFWGASAQIMGSASILHCLIPLPQTEDVWNLLTTRVSKLRPNSFFGSD